VLGENVCRHDNVGLKAGWIRREAKLNSFRIRYPMCVGRPAKAISGLIATDCYEHIRHGEGFCNNRQSAGDGHF